MIKTYEQFINSGSINKKEKLRKERKKKLENIFSLESNIALHDKITSKKY